MDKKRYFVIQEVTEKDYYEKYNGNENTDKNKDDDVFSCVYNNVTPHGLNDDYGTVSLSINDSEGLFVLVFNESVVEEKIASMENDEMSEYDDGECSICFCEDNFDDKNEDDDSEDNCFIN